MVRRAYGKSVHEPQRADYEDSSDQADEWSDSETAWQATVVGEEVHSVSMESIYEVQWKDWARPDGTNTTWHKAACLSNSNSGSDTPDIIKTWNQKREPLRKQTALQSPNIELWNDLDFHLNPTREMEQAYKLKKQKFDKNPKPYSFETLQKQLQEAYDDVRVEPGEDIHLYSSMRRSSRRPSSSSSTARRISTPARNSPLPSSTASSATPTRTKELTPNNTGLVSSGRSRRGGTDSSSTAWTHPPSTPPESILSAAGSRTLSTRTTGNRDQRVKEEDTNDDIQLLPQSRNSTSSIGTGKRKRSPAPSQSVTLSTKTQSSREPDPLAPRPKAFKRNMLSHRWSAIAARSKAASITFVNEVDNERIPPLDPDKFLYLENTYEYGKGAPRKLKPLLYCVCTRCRAMAPPSAKGKQPMYSNCNCVALFQEENEDDVHPYTPEGLVNVNVRRFQEVMECNSSCACALYPAMCGNRVAQQPRQFPIEVFKTKDCGWGVRATVDIRKGQFVGLYTGLLVSRSTRRPDIAYTFDLDARESANNGSEDGIPDEQKFTVDAKNHGNWTRFLNHSCDPNLFSYNVVIDTMPDQNTPYIAYYAARRISAYTELTFDYSPGDEPDIQDGEIKGDWQECLCGTARCRGYIKLTE